MRDTQLMSQVACSESPVQTVRGKYILARSFMFVGIVGGAVLAPLIFSLIFAIRFDPAGGIATWEALYVIGGLAIFLVSFAIVIALTTVYEVQISKESVRFRYMLSRPFNVKWDQLLPPRFRLNWEGRIAFDSLPDSPGVKAGGWGVSDGPGDNMPLWVSREQAIAILSHPSCPKWGIPSEVWVSLSLNGNGVPPPATEQEVILGLRSPTESRLAYRYGVPDSPEYVSEVQRLRSRMLVITAIMPVVLLAIGFAGIYFLPLNDFWMVELATLGVGFVLGTLLFYYVVKMASIPHRGPIHK